MNRYSEHRPRSGRRWLAEQLAEKGRGLPVDERGAWLEQACLDDPELRSEVESLLAQAEPDRESSPAAYPPTLPATTAKPIHQDPASSRFPHGTMLGERYRIVKLIGTGGMGEVYEAEDLKLDQQVALKFVSEATESDPKMLPRFLAEVKIARQISHPNVCRVYDIGEVGPHHFLSMERIDGEDLASLFSLDGTFSNARALRIAEQLAAGLEAIHQQGILHRDFKPANLMVNRRGNVKITDFGIAESNRGRRVNPRAGTPSYMSPEQHAGREVTRQSDLYALGLVLYELFTGRRAFEAETATEIAHLHQNQKPTPPSQWIPSLQPDLEILLLSCLEKDPHKRPASAQSIFESLHSIRLETQEDHSRKDSSSEHPRPPLLRDWPTPPWPEQPYPLLLPYQHPSLLAGREQDLVELKRRIRLPIPILGLYASSGVGKSSLLAGALIPALRAEGRAVALVRHPQEPGLSIQILDDLLQTVDLDLPSLPEDDPNRFVELLRAVRRLSGRPPLLVLDQFETLFQTPSRARAKAVAGLLIAASVEDQPGLDDPLCRWLLAYRKEFHGEVVTWLSDALREARGLEWTAANEFPFDLSGTERFHSLPLLPLGTPRRGTDPLREPLRVFREAIEKPLQILEDSGKPRYRFRFADDGAERLARTFAQSRLKNPDAPLVPELQVVLASLLGRAEYVDAGGLRWIEVPKALDSWMDEALAVHLRRALEAAFPSAREGGARGRARALLALRELASEVGPKRKGLPVHELARAIGPQGEEVLERLAGPLSRLIVLERHGDAWHYHLSHDRLAEVVIEQVEREGKAGSLAINSELLALRRFVHLHTELYTVGEEERATRLSRVQFRRIAQDLDALVWDDEQKAWWAACQRRYREDRRKKVMRAITLLTIASLMTIAAWLWAQRQAEWEALYEQVAGGEPGIAVQAFERLSNLPHAEPKALLDSLRQREHPLDLLENGLGGLDTKRQNKMVLSIVETALPLFEEEAENLTLIAAAAWALDFFPRRDSETREAADVLRQRMLSPLRSLRPPPAIPEPGDPRWRAIPGGTFWMGSSAEEIARRQAAGEDLVEGEGPRHQVTVSPFRVQIHEVTNREYRWLIPDNEGLDDLPAGSSRYSTAQIGWHEAYAYAAWLGGRLPTEAEWEYLTRAGCAWEYCGPDGQPVEIDAVAWYRRNTFDADSLRHVLQPAAQLVPNPFGVFDTRGSLWELVADWYGPYVSNEQIDPRGPESGRGRVLRGGSYASAKEMTRAARRLPFPSQQREIGFRVVLEVSEISLGSEQKVSQ